jgi:adenosylcobinamide-phosphate synthase
MVEMMSPMGLFVVYLLDLLFGDPEGSFHPIRILGKTIEYLERKLNMIKRNVLSEKTLGILLCSIVVISAYAITWGSIYLSHSLNSYLGIFVSIVFAYFTISIKSLGKAAKDVGNRLKEGDERSAQKYLSFIVGRDTMALNRKEIIKATVETVAENTSDGIVAPIFYLIIGGPPLGMAYKAVNTLDSMVGYKNEKYLDLGWASAKCDDLANYIPARVTGMLMIVAAMILKKDWRCAYATVRRDARKHRSPNSGYPESAVAGALRVQLGGTNYYSGVPIVTALIGQNREHLNENSIRDVVNIMRITSAIMILLGVLFLGVIQ